MATALITGASKGIGKATAKAFAHAGWDLLLVARSKNILQSLSAELEDSGSKVFFRSIDLSNPEEISSGFHDLLGNGLCPSVLINNAGVAWTGGLLSMPIDRWNWLMQVNLTSVFQVCAAVVPSMRQEGGLIINVSSHAARNAFPQWGAYCVTKAALESLTKCIAKEENEHNIRACTLTLGSVNSKLWDSDTVKSDFDREQMLSVDQVAAELLHLGEQPHSQVIEDLTLMPSAGVF
ncbi:MULTISPECIES: SDR family oxidoreductase [Prochlorococcus]|uniref:Short-chain dehydrogenase/reductase family enzyme n=1 Tax=Prochlorococcus marinus (strain SARG / CCMP1375 / SS120) TaxID=167539 RepID=Q7VD48_PROMA|nr:MULTISPECIES: SDR family oxidoreductase [Prochlorococcus]AAP99580.1 Short-chain dehydrogenase/reductase family enzyme [Prochlorococcus marinus subsp. marinus str. CCMP1375]KGG11148.1 Sepiapterin reductase [Prochlorococcus marinus str. LG]KGG21486.1 Sepiapterin reductase [Prochlorococcus marinus str. SS2]KGG23169.1 Sepiapterin reductase [Prochlorococcus marinus str. SS35]KGG33880.1 Sepiapterin reductase [Prochlorococcus marinus str. SS51]